MALSFARYRRDHFVGADLCHWRRLAARGRPVFRPRPAPSAARRSAVRPRLRRAAGLLCLAILWLGAPAGLRPRVLLLAGLVGAVTFAFGALGLLLSATFENRWGALALTAAAMLLLFLLPWMSLANYDRQKPGSGAWGSALYLTPFAAAVQLSRAG
jgi:hypothetical protein